MTLLTPVTMATLAATPSALRALLDGVPDEVRRRAPEPAMAAGDWSMHTVVAHLLDRHVIQQGRIERLVREERPAIPDVPEGDSLERSGLLDQPTEQLLATFAAKRVDAIAWFRTLDEAALARTGEHSVAGTVTVAELLNHTAYHDAQHLGQVARLLEAFADAGRGNMRIF